MKRLRILSIDEITSLSEKLVSNEYISSEIGELLLFTYKDMMQAIKDRNATISHLKVMNTKLLTETEKLETDITLLKKKRANLLEENNKLQNNNEELLIELKDIHDSLGNTITEFEDVGKQNTDTQNVTKNIDKQSTDIIIKGISTQLSNSILRYMLNNNMLDNNVDDEEQLKEFILEHKSIKSLNIRGIGEHYINEYNSVRRSLLKNSRKLDKII